MYFRELVSMWHKLQTQYFKKLFVHMQPWKKDMRENLTIQNPIIHTTPKLPKIIFSLGAIFNKQTKVHMIR